MIPSPVQLRRAVVEALAVTTDRDPGTIDESCDLAGLGLDSLDFSTVLIEVEDRLGVEVPVEVLDRLAGVEDLSTVGDVLDLLSRWELPGAPTVIVGGGGDRGAGGEGGGGGAGRDR